MTRPFVLASALLAGSLFARALFARALFARALFARALSAGALSAGALASLLALAPAAAAQTVASPEEKSTCSGLPSGIPDEVRINACTIVLNAGLETNETLAHAHSNRGGAYARMGDFTRAFGDFDAAIKLGPLDAPTFNNRGNAYVDGPRDLDRAIADFNQAVELNPQYANGYFSRARAYFYKGDAARALVDLDQAIKLDPKFKDAWIARGQNKLSQRDYNGAIADFSEVIAHDPKSADALNGRCWARAVLGVSLEGALADCNQSLTLRPNDPNTLNSLGLVNLRRGDFKAALAAFDASVSRDDQLADSVYGRGIARIRLGETASGRADLAAAKRGQLDLAAVYAGYGFPPPS